MSDDFNIKMTVRSGRVMAAIEDVFGTQAEMARATGLPSGQINAFVTMRTMPFGANGWTETAETFASWLGKYPSDLWPEHMRDVKLKKATAEFSLDMEGVRAIMGEAGQDVALQGLILSAARDVPERNLRAIRMRTEGATLDEIGADLGVTRERIRQIIDRGHKIMRKNLRRIGVKSVTDAMST